MAKGLMAVAQHQRTSHRWPALPGAATLFAPSGLCWASPTTPTVPQAIFFTDLSEKYNEVN
eukprot:scaffold310787_cov28-Prasinocladus_malaysianus.AAC.1